MLDFEDIFQTFATLTAYLTLAVIAAHLLARLLAKKEPLKLGKNSFVVLTGGCMGIGRQMALELARLYGCSILVVDRRKDLFDQITSEITAAGGTCECRYADLGSETSVD
jgi:NADPH:quinone reductase-like Zn-dependent oxidoreductase